MLVIDPDECINCGVCEPECPVQAIVSDNDPKALDFSEMNHKFSKQWPKITTKGPPAADASQWEDVPNKFAEHFSPKPGR